MHGVKRERDAATLSAKRAKDAVAIAEFQQRAAAADAARAALHATTPPPWEALLEATARVLLVNPAHYTSWNARKEALLVCGMGPAQLETERKLTLACLQLNPKSYCIWEHRKWCLGRLEVSAGGEWHHFCSYSSSLVFRAARQGTGAVPASARSRCVGARGSLRGGNGAA